MDNGYLVKSTNQFPEELPKKFANVLPKTFSKKLRKKLKNNCLICLENFERGIHYEIFKVIWKEIAEGTSLSNADNLREVCPLIYYVKFS